MYRYRHFAYIAAAALMVNYVILFIFRQNENVLAWIVPLLNIIPPLLTTVILFTVTYQCKGHNRIFWGLLTASHLCYSASIFSSSILHS